MDRKRLQVLLAFLSGIGIVLSLIIWLDAPPAAGSVTADVFYVAAGGNCGGSVPPPLCYTSIQDAVDAAAAGDEIRVAQGTYQGVQTRAGVKQHVFISKTLTLRGGYSTGDWARSYPVTQPTTLDAQGLGRGVYITGSKGMTVNLSGLVVTGGNAEGLGGDLGGVGQVGGEDAGGGIYAHKSALIIVNSVISGNVGGSLSMGKGGGVYLYEGTTRVRDSQILNNARNHTHGMWLENCEDSIIQGSTIVNNSNCGINIHDGHNITVYDNIFADNGPAGGGCFKRVEHLSVVSNTVRDNHYSGFLIEEDTYLTLTHNAVISNQGYGIHIVDRTGPGLITENTISHNLSFDDPIGGSSIEGGGIRLENAYDMEIRNNLIEDNDSILDGGGLRVNRSERIFIVSNTIAHNWSSAFGGAIYVSETPTSTVRDNLLTNNSAESGGGVFVDNSDYLRIIDNIMSRNVVTQSGGGIFLSNIGSPLIRGNVLLTNVANLRGGGVYIDASPNPSLLTNTIRGNVTSDYGGGVYINSSQSPILRNNGIADNAVGQHGGGLYLNTSDDATIRENDVSSNRADDRGAGLYVAYSDNAIIGDNDVLANTTIYTDGGGIYLYASASPILTGNYVIKNTAARYGGGLLLAWSDNARGTANTVMSNTVQDTGGGLYVESSDGFALINNVIAANHAFNQGDGVYVRGWGNSYPSAGAMLHTTIADNGGDGLFADQFATVVMTNTLLVGHSVGLYAKSSSAHVEAAYTLWDAAKAYTYTVGGGAITATHTVTGSPAFVRRGDYHIQGVSDALDAAVVTGVDTDFEGDARPSACSLDDPDIGADENTDLTVVRPVRETNTFGAACARIVFKDTGAPALETITATTHLGSLLSPKPVGMIPLLRNTTLTPSGTTPVSISLALGYTDADLAAAGLSGAEEPALRLYRDLGENRWEPYSGTVNTIHNVVTATEVTTLSRWLIGVPASPPTADFSVSPTTGVAPLTVDFTNASMGVYDACKWTFGDGNSSTECDDPSHIYAASGAYTVSLAVHGPGGYNILTRTQALTVYQAVAANFNGNPTTGLAPLAVDFTNTSTGDYDTCDWNFGDGTSSGDCSDLSHTYIASGVYTVSLAVSGLGGSDTLTETDYITVDPVASAPTAGFTANPTQGIAPLLVDFTNTSTGDYDTCVWDFGDGQSSTNCNDPSHTYTASGAYTVSLNLSGTQGGDVLTRPNYITVDPVPPAPTAAFSGHPTSGTAPLAVEFTQASSGDYDTCVWAFGDGASSTDCTGTSHTYTSAGRYTVQLTVSGPGGSDTATRSDYITVDPPAGAPTAALSADPENGLVPLTVTFTAVTSGTVDQWLWTFGDGGTASTGPVVSHTYVTTGTFDVTLTVSNTHGRFLVSKPDYIWVRSQDYVYLPLVIR